VIRVISEPQRTIYDDIFDGYARMIRTCVSWAVAEARRGNKPSLAAKEFLDDFIPNWAEIYSGHSRHSVPLKSHATRRNVVTNPDGRPQKLCPRRAIELRSQGYSIDDIAIALNISSRTVIRYLAKGKNDN